MPFLFATSEFVRRVLLSAFILIAVLAATGCNTAEKLSELAPYKVEIIQGNFVSKEMVAALKSGLTKEQVGDILGTPLLTSIFHADRWDYVFNLQRQGVASQSRRLTVFFSDNRLVRYEGDPMPSEAEFADSVYAKPWFKASPKLEMTEQEKQELSRRAEP